MRNTIPDKNTDQVVSLSERRVAKRHAQCVEKYKNIGVRIEDDILVTENGHKNLSAASPRAVREIENLMKKSSAYLK